jgi:hypothetical protein
MKPDNNNGTVLSRVYMLALCRAASPSGKLVVGSWTWNTTADDWVLPISCSQCGTVYKAMESTLKGGSSVPHSLQEYIKTHAHPINATSVLKMEKEFGNSNIKSLGNSGAKFQNEKVSEFKQQYLNEWKKKQKTNQDFQNIKVVPITKWGILPLQKDPTDIVQMKMEQMAKSLGLTVDELLAQIKGEEKKKSKPPVVEQSTPKVAPEKKGRRIR